MKNNLVRPYTLFRQLMEKERMLHLVPCDFNINFIFHRNITPEYINESHCLLLIEHSVLLYR